MDSVNFKTNYINEKGEYKDLADMFGAGDAYSPENPPPYPVKSVNGHTGDVTVKEPKFEDITLATPCAEDVESDRHIQELPFLTVGGKRLKIISRTDEKTLTKSQSTSFWLYPNWAHTYTDPETGLSFERVQVWAGAVIRSENGQFLAHDNQYYYKDKADTGSTAQVFQPRTYSDDTNFGQYVNSWTPPDSAFNSGETTAKFYVTGYFIYFEREVQENV